MVSNVMSLLPKMVEVQEFICRNNIILASITETWLKSTIADSVIDIPGYNIIRRDRTQEWRVSTSKRVTPGSQYSKKFHAAANTRSYGFSFILNASLESFCLSLLWCNTTPTGQELKTVLCKTTCSSHSL